MRMPPPMRNPMTDGIDKPKRLKDVPKYVLEKIKGFFSRLFYIFALVWQSAPFIFVAMVLLCLLDGVLPVVGAFISAELLNEISALIVERSFIGISSDAWVVMQPLAILFLINLVYLFVKRIIAKISNMITAVAGELVVNHSERNALKSKYPTFEAFEKDFELDDEAMKHLTEIASEKGIEYNEEGFLRSRRLMRNQLTAMIAQRLFSSSEFYRLLNPRQNESYQLALELLLNWQEGEKHLYPTGEQ